MKRTILIFLAFLLIMIAGCESEQGRIYESAVGSGGTASLTSEEVSALYTEPQNPVVQPSVESLPSSTPTPGTI